MKYQVNVNLTNRSIERINFERKEITYLTEGKHPADKHYTLFDNTYTFEECQVCNQSEIPWHEFKNDKGEDCITFNRNDILPWTLEEDEKYRAYDGLDFDATVEFWQEVYKPQM